MLWMNILSSKIYTVHVWLLKCKVVKAMKLLLSAALAISHKLWYIVFSSLWSFKQSVISILISLWPSNYPGEFSFSLSPVEIVNLKEIAVIDFSHYFVVVRVLTL